MRLACGRQSSGARGGYMAQLLRWKCGWKLCGYATRWRLVRWLRSSKTLSKGHPMHSLPIDTQVDGVPRCPAVSHGVPLSICCRMMLPRANWNLAELSQDRPGTVVTVEEQPLIERLEIRNIMLYNDIVVPEQLICSTIQYNGCSGKVARKSVILDVVRASTSDTGMASSEILG